MGNNSRRVEKGKAPAPPPPPPPPAGDKEEDPRLILEEKLHWTRLELQRMIALSADADETIAKLTADVHRIMREKDQAHVKLKAMEAEHQARRNAQAQAQAQAMVMATGGYGNQALVVPVPAPFGTQQQYQTWAAGPSYCFAPSSAHMSGQASFDPDMFLANAAGGDSVLPTTATGSGTHGIAGKKRLVSELGLVAEQILRLPWKNEEVVEAPVAAEKEDNTDADRSVADEKEA